MKSVSLSTGEVVTLKDFIPHNGDNAFWEEVRLRSEQNQGDLNAFGYKKCLEALLPFVIDSITGNPTDVAGWIGKIPQQDYDLLEPAVEQLRQDYIAKKQEGEKKD